MRTVGMCEAQAKFAELIDQASAGETIVVTRNGKAVAELRPIASSGRLDAAVSEILGLGWTSGSSVVDAIREAREERA